MMESKHILFSTDLQLLPLLLTFLTYSSLLCNPCLQNVRGQYSLKLTLYVSSDIIFEFYIIDLICDQNFEAHLSVKIHDCNTLPTFM